MDTYIDPLHDLESQSPHSDDMDDPIPPNPNHNNPDARTEESSGAHLCILHLTSHGHRFGPFTPPPTAPGRPTPTILQYDIRSLPNPPKNVRHQQTGLHKPLREWFFSRPEAVAKLEEVSVAIDAALEELATTDATAQGGHIYVVVFCEMGRHRSVAFVEELGRRPFFIATESGKQRCDVVIQHRDVGRAKHDPRSRRQRVDRS
ncbi:hypothetical protein C8R46DRAFT_95410 [Mycena filopes]|nr:hypothetical protein C8R46DRAFT_95410 [Mycena filopes]